MKYSLIIGHQLFEKYNSYPTIQVWINDILLDQFVCDNEESTQLDLYDERYIEINGKFGYGFKQLRLLKSQYLSPKKFTILELNSSTWSDHNVLSIQVKENFSNNTNGFITKRSVVSLNPVFLIRTDLLNDKKTMQRIMNFDLTAREDPYLLNRRGQEREHRWRWPGKTAYPFIMDTNGIVWRTDSGFEYSTKGGDFSVDFNIVKKHKNFILQQVNVVSESNKIIGIFRIDTFFRAWYQSYTKDKFISRSTARFDHDRKIQKHLSIEPAYLNTISTEIESKEHIIIHNIKNK